MEIILKKLEQLEVLIKTQKNLSKELLTLEEASEYLQLSKSCIYKLTSKREIPFYIPGGKKIYFKKVDLENWIIEGKVESTSEIDLNLQAYLSRTNKNSKS